MEIVANNATVMSERQPVGISDKFIQLFHRKTGIPDLSSVVVNFAITARLFPFWNLSVQYTEQFSLESVQWAKHYENLDAALYSPTSYPSPSHPQSEGSG